MSKRVGIIGAGPAGIMASIVAAKSGWQVLLFDSNAVVGRKLLVTGGGRCNITNARINEDVYHSNDKTFVKTALKKFGLQDLINQLEHLGIPVYSTDDGWFYPLSNSAGNVADIFDAVLDQCGVEKILNTAITQIKHEPKGFHLFGAEKGKTFWVDKLIVASGGKAYPNLGSRGDLFEKLSGFGHKFFPFCPL